MIPSFCSPEEIIWRGAQRETWMRWINNNSITNCNVTYHFFIGNCENKYGTDEIRNESKYFNDIIILQNFTEDWEALQMKSIQMILHEYKYNPYFDLLLKLDSDMFVNIPLLCSVMTELNHQENVNKNALYYGELVLHGNIIADNDTAHHKKYYNQQWYQHVYHEKMDGQKQYLPYMRGAAYILSFETVKIISNAVVNNLNKLSYSRFEDSYIGHLLSIFDVKFIHATNFYGGATSEVWNYNGSVVIHCDTDYFCMKHQFQLQTNVSTNYISNFDISTKHTNPFKQGWSFDDYKIYSTNYNHIELDKLKLPYIFIEHFYMGTIEYQVYNFPITNLAIIRIDNIPNYYNEVLSTYTNTVYIGIGKYHTTFCSQSGADSYYKYDYADDEYVGSGIILLDNSFNVIAYVKLEIIYNSMSYHMNKHHLTKLEDCKIFAFRNKIYISCISHQVYGFGYPDYSEQLAMHIPNNYISPLVWTMRSESTNSTQMSKSHYIIAQIHADKTFVLRHNPIQKRFGLLPKNIIPLQYNNDLYFLWELQHSYFIQLDYDIYDTDKDVIYGYSAYFNSETISNISVSSETNSYHLNAGFIHLNETNEYLGIGHIHYDLYKNKTLSQLIGIEYGSHYTHFFFTIHDTPPFFINRISKQFCFLSKYIGQTDETADCSVLQFVGGITENKINEIDYFFISYGINDCVSSIAKIKKSAAMNMLHDV